MHTHSFSAAQATHALDVVLKLMKERRFFLYWQDTYSIQIEGASGHHLDMSLFGPAFRLDQDIRAIYAAATIKAKESITNAERSLGLKAPDLSGNKQLVRCNCYTGGLDICRVYPVTAFTELAPATVDELQAQETIRLLGNKTVEDCSPKEMRELQERAHTNGSRIWKELEAIKTRESGNSCVVLLKTRFEPVGGEREDDFLEGRLAGIPLFPYAMGYLFYQYSKRTRIVRHNHVAFNASRRAHVNVQHWTDGELSLRFDSTGGYSCKVYFPIVL